MFKRMLLAGAATAFIASGAYAADIIEPAAYDWSGPYLGLQAGYGWGENDIRNETLPPDTTNETLQRGGSDPLVTDPSRDGSIKLGDFIGGLHAGYSWQSDSLVLGAEGDIEYSGLSGDTRYYLAPPEEGFTPAGKIEQDINWLGSLRVRAGLAFDRALVYATGGLAVGDIDMKVTNTDEHSVDATETAWGWTIGGGFEFALTDAVSARIEYRYTDLAGTDVGSPIEKLGEKVEFDNDFHAVRAGLSWHF
ncbi:MAG: outer membrane protein [Pseudomonadota bacterium]